MVNRIDQCFASLRGRNEKGFIAYICAGDPSLAKTVELALAFESAGVDLLELGAPFSDPLADGIVNQLAAQRALEAGATVDGVLECVRQIRRASEMPLVLYTYLNPIFQYGYGRFHADAAAAGVDGLLILDLPPDEDPTTTNGAVLHIRLVAPTTTPQRRQTICKSAAGFIYYVSREGVTGAQGAVAASLEEHVRELRACAGIPIAVGFGISTAAQARQVAQCADAVVVGSAIVDQIREHQRDSEMVSKVAAFVRPLVDAVRAR